MPGTGGQYHRNIQKVLLITINSFTKADYPFKIGFKADLISKM